MTDDSAIFTARDYAILRGIALHRPLAPRGYYTLLNTKLLSATVVEDAAVEPEVVSLESLVRYRVAAGKSLEHRLIIGSAGALGGKTVSVRSIVGLAMLGARSGQSVALPGPEEQTVTIESVERAAEVAPTRLRPDPWNLR